MKFTLTLSGRMEEAVLALAALRGISEQEAVRVLLGDALESRGRLQHSPDVSSILQTPPGSSASAASPQTPLGLSVVSSVATLPGVLPDSSSPYIPLPLTAEPEKPKRRPKREPCGPPEPPPEIDSPELRAALVDFEAHRRSIRKPINVEGWKLLLNRLAAAGRAEAATAVRWTIAQGWNSWDASWMKQTWPEIRLALGLPGGAAAPAGQRVPARASPSIAWGPPGTVLTRHGYLTPEQVKEL